MKLKRIEGGWTDKWDDDWGIEVISEGHTIIICLECYCKMMRW
ncbi:MAG: hypothetical protein NZ932_04080 [Candidatus Bathyarchaeota archaeon]|nr:hypothetical protein [Candidatus Bathyarchaeota archaeon]MDW8022352.1 hypothetical protein [Nitrososphaerota archaeon]